MPESQQCGCGIRRANPLVERGRAAEHARCARRPAQRIRSEVPRGRGRRAPAGAPVPPRFVAAPFPLLRSIVMRRPSSQRLPTRPKRSTVCTHSSTRATAYSSRRSICTARSPANFNPWCGSSAGATACGEPAPPVHRYERPHPGDLLHLDIKKLGRFGRPGHRVTATRQHRRQGAGWEYVHVCVDDHSRVAFTQLYPNERGERATAFLTAAVDYYRRLGITVRRVLTDNGGGYRSSAFNARCRKLGLRHRYTKPFTPRTNGKAERFIQTALREWPMPTPTTPQRNAPSTSNPGSTATIGIGHTPVSRPDRPSVDSI